MGIDTEFFGTIQLDYEVENLTELWNTYKASVENLTGEGESPLLWKLVDSELHPIVVDGDRRYRAAVGPWAKWLDHIREHFILKNELTVVRNHLPYETLPGDAFSGILQVTTDGVFTYEITEDSDGPEITEYTF